MDELWKKLLFLLPIIAFTDHFGEALSIHFHTSLWAVFQKDQISRSWRLRLMVILTAPVNASQPLKKENSMFSALKHSRNKEIQQFTVFHRLRSLIFQAFLDMYTKKVRKIKGSEGVMKPVENISHIVEKLLKKWKTWVLCLDLQGFNQ